MAGPSSADPKGVPETENQVAADAAPAGKGGAPPSRISARIASRREAVPPPPVPSPAATAPAGPSGSGANPEEVVAPARERAGGDKGKEPATEASPTPTPAATAARVAATRPYPDLETLGRQVEHLTEQLAVERSTAAANLDRLSDILQASLAHGEQAEKRAAV